MKIAVVILNWNGAELLRRYLPTVISCSRGTDAQVIVADNASTDHSLSLLASEFPSVPVIRLDRNYGFAEGYNRALRQLEADYYLLLNSDVEIRQPRWLDPLLHYMETHPECAACQPKLRSLRQPEQFEYAGAAGGYLDRYGYPFCRGRLLGTIERDTGQYDDIRPLLWATGAALMVRAVDYWAAGGLDARFFAHMEEIDLCWRLRTLGHQIVCVSQSVAYHLGGATLSPRNPRKTFLNFRNNLLMLYKNLPEHELRHVMCVRRLLDWVAAFQFLLRADWGDFRAVFRARRAYRRLRPEFAADRQQLLARAVVPDVDERHSFCLLWQYYFRCRRRFSQLPS